MLFNVVRFPPTSSSTNRSTNKAGPSEFCEVMEDRTRNLVDSNYYQASLSTIEDHCERKVCIEVMQVKYPVRGRRCPVIEQKKKQVLVYKVYLQTLKISCV